MKMSFLAFISLLVFTSVSPSLAQAASVGSCADIEEDAKKAAVLAAMNYENPRAGQDPESVANIQAERKGMFSKMGGQQGSIVQDVSNSAQLVTLTYQSGAIFALVGCTGEKNVVLISGSYYVRLGEDSTASGNL
jgi:hypothetical protein